MLDTFWGWAIPFVCGGAISGVVAYFAAWKKKKTALENGVCALLRAEIIRENKEYTAKGYCPIYAKDALTRTYQAYHALGGNDVATKLYDEIMELQEENK